MSRSNMVAVLSLDTSTILVFLFVFLLGYFVLKKKRNLPPGPLPMPVIGNLWQLGQHKRDMHKYFRALGAKYGGLFSVRIGPRRVLVLTDYDLIHQALVKQADAFSGRPQYMALVQLTHGAEGVIWGVGQKWKTLRRQSLVALRDFGVGKKSLEERIQEEARAAMEVIRQKNGKAFEGKELLQEAVSNIICSIVFGSRFEYEDEQFQRLVGMINYNITSTQLGDPALIFTFLFRILRKKAFQNVKNMQNFISDQIMEHRKTFDPENIRDFVDLHIESEIIAKEKATTHDAKSSGTSLKRTIFDLFFAGTETSSTTLNWALLFMILFPEIQHKCQDEIDREVGDAKQPGLADREKCTYVEATLLEIQRHATIVPLSVPHSTTEDTTLAGYDILKDTLVLVNLYAVHRDPKLWDNPEEFKPERWLDNNGKIQKKEAFIPFSVGPRACMGELLAKMELFLFFSSLLQQFTFRTEDENNPPTLEGVLGVTRYPKPYKICAHAR